MTNVAECLLSLTTSTTGRVVLLARSSILLIGLAVIVLAVGVAGGVLLFLRNKWRANSERQRVSPVDTSLLPKIPHEDVASVFARRETPPATPAPLATSASQRNPPTPPTPIPPFAVASSFPASMPMSTLTSTPAPIPVSSPTPAPMSMRTLMNMQKSYPQQQTSSSTPSILPATLPSEQLPETPRPHPQVSGSTLQQLSSHDAVLEVLMRQAQRGIFAIPDKSAP